MQAGKGICVFFIFLVLITAPLYTISNNNADTVKAQASGSLLKSKVIYKAQDSIRFNIAEQKVYLFGNADVKYEDISLTAAYIELDLNNNLVFAESGKDTSGKETGVPKFDEGGQSFSAKKIKYNFETKKGKITDVITQEGEGYIHGETVKKDTSNIFYIKKGRYTTCNQEHPHFFIGATKLKVIPNDKIITGPAYLSVADIPTPLAVPFGFFPNKKGQSSGIIIPTYGESPQLGFFLKDGGYYFGINDHIDLALKGDIYSRGSWGVKTFTNYKTRYKYNGSLNLNYARIYIGVPETPDFTSTNDFFIRWSHVQDPKAKPGRNFSANVNAGSSTYNTFNSNNSRDYLTNTFQSNINYNKSFTGTPFNLAASARHSQNTLTKQVDVSLPEITLAMNRIYPLKNKNRIEPKWYDKIGISWTSNAINSINTYDSLLFSEQSIDVMRNAIRHTVPISTSFNLFKYLTLTPAINGSSVWYFKTINKIYNTTLDTLLVDTVNGFRMANEFSTSASLSTKLYGMYQFKRGTLKAIRHLMIPNASISYRPDFGESKYGYYKTVVINAEGETQKYSIFQNGIYGSPASGKSGVVSMGLSNTVEMKLKPKADTSNTDRKVALIQALNFNTSYNLALDSFNWSTIGVNGRTQLFKKLDVNTNATFDPYCINEEGARINRYEWTSNKRIGRLTNASIALGTSIRSKEKTNNKKSSNKATEDQLNYIKTHPNEFIDFSIPWSLTFSYNLQYSKPALVQTVTQALNFSGDLSLTKKWKIAFNSGYDFVQKDFSYTSLNIYRDLHCWEMSFNWVPFGFRQSYTIDIRVKASVLQDLKLTRKRDWYDFQ